MAESELADDAITPFQVAGTAVRGRIVRLGGAVDDILSAHGFEPMVSELLGEVVSLVAMMGSSLKFDGKLIFQAQGDGPVSMIVADYSGGGNLRGTAKASGAVNGRGAKALIGTGHVVLTIDQGPDMDRYQGVTALDGETLGEAAAAYFRQSEQIPTVVRLAVGKIREAGGRERWRAGGIIVQYVPGEGGRERGEEVHMDDAARDSWERAAAFVSSTQDDELLDPTISVETLLYRLFHEDGVRVFARQPVRAACSCTSDKIAAVLGRYDPTDLADMVEDGYIRVSCEFCRKDYRFTPEGALAEPS